MKKILSLTLALLMLVSAVPMVHAAGNWEGGTTVTYSATTGAEEWTVTVPATLTVCGGGGDVTASGTWAANRKLVVKSATYVDLLNNITNSDRFILPVTFAGISLVGNNTAAVTDTEVISVDYDISDEALFGTWSGVIEYDVEMVDAEMIKFTVYNNIDGETYEHSVLEGTTWASLTRGLENEFYDNGDSIGYRTNDGGIYMLAFDEYDNLSMAYPIDDEIIAGASYTFGEFIFP